jgi:phosphatidylglycerol:prolipoprotein diacylglycerol transferase
MPQGFSIGPLFIHFYGILIMLGVIMATWVATRQAKFYGQNPDIAWDALPWVLIAGIIGARLWHVLTPPASMIEQGITTQYYFTHPLEILAIWKGGLGIPGAVIGGAIALFFFARARKLSFLQWADFIAPGLILAQAIGRWGNFLNQELYGQPSNLPWAIYIDPAHRLPGYANVAYYQPLFLYESLWNLLVMGFLLWVSRRFTNQLKKGYVFQFYLILYPFGRFWLEFLRLDPSPVAGIDINQALMAVIALGSLAILLWRQFRSPGVEAQGSQDEIGPEGEESTYKGEVSKVGEEIVTEKPN